MPSPPSVNKTLAITILNYAKADIKDFLVLSVFNWFLYFAPDVVNRVVNISSLLWPMLIYEDNCYNVAKTFLTAWLSIYLTIYLLKVDFSIHWKQEGTYL